MHAYMMIFSTNALNHLPADQFNKTIIYIHVLFWFKCSEPQIVLQWKLGKKKNGTALRLNCLWWGGEGFSSRYEMETFFVWTCFNPDRETIKLRSYEKPPAKKQHFVSGFVIRHKDTHTSGLTQTQSDAFLINYFQSLQPSFWANLKVALSHINHVIACTVLWRNVSLKPWKAKISH